MMHRRTALLKAHPRTDWGGSYADSGTWAQLFKQSSPYDFGVMGAQTFASQLGSHIVNKPLLWLSQGMGNVMELPGGHNSYQWQLATDTHTRATIMEVDANLPEFPGLADTEFYIYLNRNWYHEPTRLKTEGIDQPLLTIIGYGQEFQPGVYRYKVKVQDGQSGAFVDPAYLAVGMTVVDATTGVSDELNRKYSGIEFGSHYNLSSHIGYVARKIEVTDKFIRLEIGARSSGKAPSRGYMFDGKVQKDAIGTGYVIARRDKNGKPIHTKTNPGAAITTAEALLEDRIAMDKEMGMTFGRVEITTDSATNRPVYTGAGWLQMSRDGNYKEHNGNLTLGDFSDKLDSLYVNAVDPSNRKVYIRTGEEGIKFASRLISTEAGVSPFIFDSSYFIEPTKATYTDKALRWGAQFTEFRGMNGQLLCFVHDPSKNNPYFYPELHPDTNRPVESGSYDIMDLGATDAAPAEAKTKSNIAYIYEPEYEEYYMVSNVYDLMTGSVKDGSNVSSNSKEAGIYRASSYKLEIWDISRTMRLAAVI